MITAILLGLTITLLLLKLSTILKPHKRKNLPPLIPGGIPYIGNVIGFDTQRPHMTLTSWAKQYGDIYRIRLFNEDTVVINSVDLVREALIENGEIFAGRPKIFRITYGFHGAKDIIFGTTSPKWSFMKKISSQTLKDYGAGREEIDNMVTEEAESLIRAFTDTQGEPIDPTLIVLTTIVNTISSSVIGKRYKHDDPRMERYHRTTRMFSESCSPIRGMELDLFPWLRFLPNSTFKMLTESRAMLDSLIDDELEDLKKCSQGERPKCVISELQNVYSNSSKCELTDKDIRAIFIDLLVSGTFTTSIALNAFLLIMACHQDIQTKMRKEVEKLKYSNQSGLEITKDDLQYSQAVILEIMRYISHVPLCLPHYTVEDTNLGEYDIPTNTQVLLNLWSIHHDPRLWDEPWSYNPERFLNSSGKLLPASHQHRKCLLPFSAGRRACIGESLAKDRLLTFTTNIIKHFYIDAKDTLSCDPRDFQLGLILEPKSFNVKFVHI